MPKKITFCGLFLAIGITFLTACGNVGSVSPHTSGQTVHPLCNTPQQPNCK